MSQNSTASLSAPCYRLPQIVGVSWSISLKAGAKVETFYLYTNYFDGFFQNIFKQFHLCLIIKNFIYQKKTTNIILVIPGELGRGRSDRNVRQYHYFLLSHLCCNHATATLPAIPPRILTTPAHKPSAKFPSQEFRLKVMQLPNIK